MIFLLTALAAFFNAVCDSMEHHPDYWPFTPFWNTRHPDNDKVAKIGGWPIDGWHIAKTLMLLCLFLCPFYTEVMDWYLQLGIMAVVWILTFNLFYNKVFK